MSRFVRTLGLTTASLISWLDVEAQVAPPSVSLGFAVDTTVTDVGNVARLVRAYLAKPDSSARSRGLWSTSSKFDRRFGDITAGSIYQGFRTTIVGVIPASLSDSVYVVKLLHATADSGGRHISPLSLQRLYAVRETGAPFGFRLSAPLPRLTKNWEHRDKGRLTFWYAPGIRPNPRKMAHAAKFVDSLAALFEVRPPTHLDVYIASTLDEAQRATGLDFDLEGSGPGNGFGGRTLPSGIILVGHPNIGEEYFHEFVHAVVGPLRPGNSLIGEGISVWLGGSQGRETSELFAILGRAPETDPALTLAGVLDYDFENKPAKLGSDLQHATGALVANAVFNRRGIKALRNFLQLRGDTQTLLRELATQLGLPFGDRESLDKWWRLETKRLQSEGAVTPTKVR